MIIYSTNAVRNGSRSVRVRALDRTSHLLAVKRAIEQKKRKDEISSQNQLSHFSVPDFDKTGKNKDGV